MGVFVLKAAVLSSFIFCMNWSHASGAEASSQREDSEGLDQFDTESSLRDFRLRELISPSAASTPKWASGDLKAMLYFIARSKTALTPKEILAIRDQDWTEEKTTIEKFAIIAAELVILDQDDLIVNKSWEHFCDIQSHILNAKKYGHGKNSKLFFNKAFFNNSSFASLATVVNANDSKQALIAKAPYDIVWVDEEAKATTQIWSNRVIKGYSYEPISAIVVRKEKSTSLAYDVLLKDGDKEAYIKGNRPETTLKQIDEIDPNREVRALAIWYRLTSNAEAFNAPQRPTCCLIQ